MHVCFLLSVLLFYAFVMKVDDMTKNGWMNLLCFFASKTLRISSLVVVMDQVALRLTTSCTLISAQKSMQDISNTCL